MTRFSWEIDGWEPPEDHGDPLDPHDTLADPERHAHLTPGDDRRERAEREADLILSDFGATSIEQLFSGRPSAARGRVMTHVERVAADLRDEATALRADARDYGQWVRSLLQEYQDPVHPQDRDLVLSTCAYATREAYRTAVRAIEAQIRAETWRREHRRMSDANDSR